MARAGTGGEQDDVDPDIVAWPRIARHQIFRRRRDARKPAFVDREVEFGGGRARLNLDERDQRALARDDVDLAGGRADAAVEDAPALQPQPPAGDPLPTPPRGLRDPSLGGARRPLAGGARGGGDQAFAFSSSARA